MRILTEMPETHIVGTPEAWIEQASKDSQGVVMGGWIPANIFPRQTEPVYAAALVPGANIHKTVPEAVAYEMVKLLWENREELSQLYPVQPEPLLDFPAYAVEKNATYKLPFHAGAVKFYRELGVEVPEEMLPPELK